MNRHCLCNHRYADKEPLQSKMLSRHQCLLNTVLEFYQNPDHVETVYSIADQSYFVPNHEPSPPSDATSSGTTTPPAPNASTRKLVSVRILNWFVSNFAKFHMTAYNPADYGSELPDAQGTQFVVWNQYGAAKAGYRDKDMFDPYCRNSHPVCVSRHDGTRFRSNLGQLNFFKWAIRNRIIDYVCAHYDDIVRDLADRMPRNVTAKNRVHPVGGTGTKTRKKREEISASACQGIAFISLVRETKTPRDVYQEVEDDLSLDEVPLN